MINMDDKPAIRKFGFEPPAKSGGLNGSTQHSAQTHIH
jgi:hypothetical protein